MQIKKLADDLGVQVTLVKNFLRASGFAGGGRDFAGSEADLTREEVSAVKAAHDAGLLKRNRGATIDVVVEDEQPDPTVTSGDLAALPAVEVGAEPLAVRGEERHPIFVHGEILEWLGNPKTPLAHRRICTRRIQELPVRRMGTVEDVAHVAVFLASERSGFLTGQILHASGGLVMT